MYENTIDQILYKDDYTKEIYTGSFALDELPKQPKYPSALIVNTEPRNQPGEHWLALYYSKSGVCDFFDSYGQPPSFYNLESYIDSTSNIWNWNKRRLQGDSNYCGYYAILFLLYRSRNKTISFYQEFYLNFSKNDKKIFKLIKEFS